MLKLASVQPATYRVQTFRSVSVPRFKQLSAPMTSSASANGQHGSRAQGEWACVAQPPSRTKICGVPD